MGESKDFVPAEKIKFFIAATNQWIKRKGEVISLSEPDEFQTPKKSKAANVEIEQEWTPFQQVLRSERVIVKSHPQPESEEIEDMEVDGSLRRMTI